LEINFVLEPDHVSHTLQQTSMYYIILLFFCHLMLLKYYQHHYKWYYRPYIVAFTLNSSIIFYSPVRNHLHFKFSVPGNEYGWMSNFPDLAVRKWSMQMYMGFWRHRKIKCTEAINWHEKIILNKPFKVMIDFDKLLSNLFFEIN
jgi:hypothetical protein